MTNRNLNKTMPTDVKVEDFINSLSDKRKKETKIIIDIMKNISKSEPKMWGPSIVGFGEEKYSYKSGRSGIIPKLSFSPRIKKLTFYIDTSSKEYRKELQLLGKYTTSVSCLYINKLEDIDLDVLMKIFKIKWELKNNDKKVDSLEGYIESIPEVAKEKFFTLREIVKDNIEDAKEVLSYGILGYKVDKGRGIVFIGGYKDHVAMYPIPNEDKLKEELKGYIRGKGTLWFGLNETLPEDLIKKVVSQLILEGKNSKEKKIKTKKEKSKENLT